MNKKFGWTLTEVMVVMIFIIAISGFLASVFKPRTQNAKIQAYAAIRNITKGVIAVHDKYSSRESDPTDDIFAGDEEPIDGKSKFCLEMADAFALKKTPECTQEGQSGYKIGTPNLVLANGVEVYGLAQKPTYPIGFGNKMEYSYIKYKDILIDVDGKSKGMNKLGVDRFPLRIYLEDNLILPIIPVNCNEANDKYFDWKEDQMLNIVQSPFCKKGKEFDGAQSTQNFWNDDEIITYDTYRATISDQKGKTTQMVGFAQSLATTICGNFGGKRFLSAQQCANLKKHLFKECVKEETCDICSTVSPSICPLKSDGTSVMSKDECMQTYTALNNEDNTCLFLLHKPASGLSSIVGAIVGTDLDME